MGAVGCFARMLTYSCQTDRTITLILEDDAEERTKVRASSLGVAAENGRKTASPAVFALWCD